MGVQHEAGLGLAGRGGPQDLPDRKGWDWGRRLGPSSLKVGEGPFIPLHPAPQRGWCPPTGEVGLVPLLEDVLGDLLIAGTLVQIAVKAAQGVLLDDAAH